MWKPGCRESGSHNQAFQPCPCFYVKSVGACRPEGLGDDGEQGCPTAPQGGTRAQDTRSPLSLLRLGWGPSPPTFLCFGGGMIHFLPIILDWIWSGHPKFCNIFRNDSNREQLERGISFLRPLKACHCPAPRLSSPSSVSRRTQTTGRGDLSIVRWSWPDRLVTMM